MSDKVYNSGDSPASVGPAEISDQEVDIQKEQTNSDDAKDVSEKSNQDHTPTESPSQIEASVSQDPPSSFQLGSQDGQEDVFAADSDSDIEILAAIKAVTRDEDSSPVKQKRRILSDSDLEEGGAQGEADGSPPPTKKIRVDDDSGNEGNQDEEEDSVGEATEIQAEVEDLESVGGAEMAREEMVGGEEEGSDEEPDDNIGGTSGMSDWDIMMQRRKDAMASARRARRKRDGGDDLSNDEHIAAMIGQMKMAAEDDRHLNMERKAATKKLQMLPTVVAHLKKVDLVSAFLDQDILSALSDWVSPLPDHSLPHLKIRESVIDILRSFPIPDSSVLKQSKIGKAVMLLYRHPKETRKNREKAGKIINEWARPIFGLASDFKSLTRDEREERDYAHLSQSKKTRLSSGERRPSQDDDFEAPQKPGDRGWVGRARVPMPSTNDYVVRPKWNVDQKLPRKTSKKVMNRYEKQIQKDKQRKTQNKTTHAVSISVEGRNMPL
ncbi:protein IWS1 homolog isoform X2 [Halichondria panicea]|uniref:protein IWS1 homolog isoform X2 n=1 Tax=Halichondria panicea TaxID=6063 RepID=UPI00312B89A9